MAATPMTITLRVTGKAYQRLSQVARQRGYSATGYAHLDRKSVV